MSRAPWLGRPAGRHAAGARGRGKPAAGGETAPRPAPIPEVPLPQVPLREARLREVPLPDAAPAGPVGRHAAASSASAAGLLGAPVTADAGPAAPAPLVSPVTDAARAAAAASAASLPAYYPAGAAPLITLDALGRKCPIPIIMLAERIRDIPVGMVVAVLADDPATYTDIPAWCGLKSHDCVFRVDYATGWSFGIRRRY